MTDRDFHGGGACGDHCDPKKIEITCKNEIVPQKIDLRSIIMAILTIIFGGAATAGGAGGVTYIFFPTLMERIVDHVKGEVAGGFEDCAQQIAAAYKAERSRGNDYAVLSDECAGAKRLVDSLEFPISDKDKKEIAKLVIGELGNFDGCVGKKCRPPEPEPLIRPGSDIRLKRGQQLFCGQYDWIIEYAPDGKDWKSIPPDYLFNPEKSGQISLPKFCNGGGEMAWVLLDQPRVYYSVSSTVKSRDADGKIVELEHHQAPYVMFVAMEERSRRIANAYFIYIDARSGRPAMVEISFESLRQKPLISLEGNTQLVSNLKLDSDGKQITFQIGARAQEMTIAGYDFGPDTTPGDAAGRGQADTSGAYVVELNQSGAVTDVYIR